VNGSAEELRIGTRGSQLALWQAHTVASRIVAIGGPPCRIVTIKTSGDRLQEAPLSEVGGKRLFVKEIEDALGRGDIDLAVHSSKDMPAVLPEGLTIGAVLPREDPLDAIVLPLRPVDDAGAARDVSSATAAQTTVASIEDMNRRLGRAAVLGTGSVRRVAQLTRLVPGARFMPIRGNLDTRLRKLDAGEYDALVLAAAGLRRLGFAGRISLALPSTACVPAPGQGIVAIEVKAGDEVVRRIVSNIDDPASAAALDAERAVVTTLGGGCQTPIGALATPVEEDTLDLVATVVSLDGSRILRRQARGPRSDAVALGVTVANGLIEDGANEILEEIHRALGAVEGIQP
jgi:hydroxymethylbilane synthase